MMIQTQNVHDKKRDLIQDESLTEDQKGTLYTVLSLEEKMENLLVHNKNFRNGYYKGNCEGYRHVDVDDLISDMKRWQSWLQEDVENVFLLLRDTLESEEQLKNKQSEVLILLEQGKVEEAKALLKS